WAIYTSEAERYDSALIESWKDDMSGFLIFSGLFSAVLTAFLIENYKNLENKNLILLSRVLTQLNDMSLPIPSSPPPFKIDPSSLICNAFWSLSVGLSLTCVLLATLVVQWARMHKKEVCLSPVRRARVFSFRYYGVRRFGMHAIVDIIPMLLHLAVVLFFSGIVAFLLPINRITTALVASILAAFLAFYCGLTVMQRQRILDWLSPSMQTLPPTRRPPHIDRTDSHPYTPIHVKHRKRSSSVHSATSSVSAVWSNLFHTHGLLV
ncbi:hypothetical protein C8J57DRAFT_1075424, partial [Mycena rebaudengoi]